ncbi:MAG: uroporphyrinogen-III synthase [Rhodocyclales bacterium]|nr:uroporphyrinogen-III synthase [Rhodocyclales bacterium]
MTAASPLAGRTIVVTRPAGQATHLADALIALGAKPILFPVLAIFDVGDPAALQDVAIRLDEFDWACFVSPNAVEKSLSAILARRAWPAGLRAATVGKSSEMALAKFGITDVVAPQGRFDSEALLDLPELQDMKARRVVIFRGDGGRELLGDTLRQRGAEVEYVACYRRDKPDLDPAPLLKLWGDGHLDGVTVTSSEGLHNLVDMVGKLGQTWLKKTPLFVPHQRIAGLARALGCHEVILTGPGDDGLVAGLLEYYRDHARVA